MPQRQNTFQVDSATVQGEGAYVVLRRMSWKDMQHNNLTLAEFNGGELPRSMDTLRLTTEFLATNTDITAKTLQQAVVAWNWVDDAGAPLPLPSAGGMEKLSDQEVQFLIRALQPQAEALKN
jgi:hypothetical protein